MNFLNVQSAGPNAGIPGLGVIPAGIQKGVAVEIGIRPEHIALTESTNAALCGEVELIERLGAETYGYMRVAGQAANITMHLPGDINLRPGAIVGLQPDWERVHWFDAAGRVLLSAD